MVQGDLLRQLFRGFSKRDNATFLTAAEAIIQEERLKNHRLLADDLERILMNGTRQNGTTRQNDVMYEIPKDKERGFPLVEIATHDFDWDHLVVPEKTLSVLKQIANEHHRRDILATAGLKPQRRVLFFGPPGCGKTKAAQVMAAVLSYPLVTVRFDAVVSSYLGETAANLRRVFDFIQRGQWVVLFDEFDAIGKDRDNPFEHGELKRVVNSMLQMMDAFRGESLLIAATNHEGLLDKAVWRRFEAVIHFPKPTEQDRILLLRRFLRGFDTSKVSLDTFARQMKQATGADLERFSLEAARFAILDGRNELTDEDVNAALRHFRDRMALMRKVSENETHSTQVVSGTPKDRETTTDGEES